MSPKENVESRQAIPEMVRDLVRRAEAKVAELEARKQYLRRRVQALRFLATHAAQERSRERPDTLASGQVSSAHSLNRSEHDVKPARSDQDSGRGTTSLRRACRIALMESDEPQTSAQIYQRICKRGSVSFQSSIDALHVLSAELDLMAKESEITCRILLGEKRWQRHFCE
jgi:multidrug resistance efflux pump